MEDIDYEELYASDPDMHVDINALYDDDVAREITASVPRTKDNRKFWITPEWAEDVLTNRNTFNRPMDMQLVTKYRHSMESRKWGGNVNDIKFVFEPGSIHHGSVTDGQHRLKACILAKTPFVSNINFIRLAEAMYVDRNRPRTVAQNIEMCNPSDAKGYIKGQHIVKAIDSVIRYLKGHAFTTSGSTIFTQRKTETETLNIWKEIKNAVTETNALPVIPGVNKNYYRAMMAILWLGGVDRQKSVFRKFYTELMNHDNNTDGFIHKRMQMLNTTYSQQAAKQIVDAMIDIWNYVITDKNEIADTPALYSVDVESIAKIFGIKEPARQPNTLDKKIKSMTAK